MKRIIDGVTYNTDTSTVIARAEVVDDEWPNRGERRVLTLYQTRGGAFFVHIDTVTMRFSPRDQEWQEDERHVFEAMTRDQAHAWVMDGQVELLNDVFGEPPDAAAEVAPSATLYIRVPVALKDQIEAAAAGDKLSVNAWAIRCMEGCIASRLTDASETDRTPRLSQAARILERAGYKRMPDGSYKAPDRPSAA